MNPAQREFVRLAQILKAQLITKMELKQRVTERTLIEDRMGSYDKELERINADEKVVRAEFDLAAKNLAGTTNEIIDSLSVILGELQAVSGEVAASSSIMDTIDSVKIELASKLGIKLGIIPRLDSPPDEKWSKTEKWIGSKIPANMKAQSFEVKSKDKISSAKSAQSSLVLTMNSGDADATFQIDTAEFREQMSKLNKVYGMFEGIVFWEPYRGVYNRSKKLLDTVNEAVDNRKKSIPAAD